MIMNARHFFVDESGDSSLETNLSGVSNFFVIAALIVNIIICFCGIAVAETEGLGWQKRYPEKPYFLQVQDSKTPNQGENNVEDYYFKTYRESPFVLGGDGHGKRAWTLKDGRTSPENTLELNYDYIKTPHHDYRTMETFGTFTVTHPLSGVPLFTIRPAQYVVGRNQDGSPQLGVRPIPVDDKSDNGHTIMDAFLREKMKLTADDYIFAPIFYYHPEQYLGSLLELSKTEMYRIVDGLTHMSVYIGQGRTRSSPKNYHRMKWEVMDEKNGYPAQVVQVNYDGVPADEFNKNAYIALRLLNEGNEGVQFTRLDYKRDYYNAINLKEILDFYRAWLDPFWIRAESDNNIPYYKMIKHWLKHDTYCSEHITMVLNVALNLVQTEAGYIATFGRDSEQPDLEAAKQLNGVNKGGEWFWKRAQIVWKQVAGNEPFPQVDDTVMMPLWSRPGHVHTVNKNVGRRKLVAGKPIKPGEAPLVTYPGVSMAWAPMTIVDLISDFMELYARWDKIGPDFSIEVLNGFEGEVADRLEWQNKKARRKYQKIIQPFVELIVKYSTLSKEQNIQSAEVYNQFVELIVKYSTLSKEQNIPPAEAYNQFRLAEAVETEKLRNCSDYNIGSDTFWFYSPPSVINRIIQGLHRRNRYVSFEIIATAFQREHLQETVSTASPF